MLNGVARSHAQEGGLGNWTGWSLKNCFEDPVKNIIHLKLNTEYFRGLKASFI